MLVPELNRPVLAVSSSRSRTPVDCGRTKARLMLLLPVLANPMLLLPLLAKPRLKSPALPIRSCSAQVA